ncbi:protein Bouncer [Triplophysa rosa]|uniref:protein Bouncer n=1 Tax=Triplophysa rosa TaxID=992332 RepID=UPI002545E0BE|nr:protein Bouncer [Triplophysa rosa]
MSLDCAVISSVLLLLAALLSSDGLLCNYCPLQVRHKNCSNITTTCRPHERCFSSRGRYGRVHMLSGQGCVAQELCGLHQTLMYMGVGYNVTYACCCHNLCNSSPAVDNSLKLLLGVTVGPANNITDIDLLNNCLEN